MENRFSGRHVAGPVVYSSPSFHHLRRAPKKFGGKSNQLFDFQLAEGISESVRSDKASRAGIWALAVSPKNRCLRICRPADLQLPSGRLKLPVLQSGDKRLSGDSRTANNAREQNKRREGCARVSQNFAVSPNGIRAKPALKHDLVICAARGRYKVRG